MKKHLLLILAGISLFSARVVAETQLPPNTQLLKYVLVVLAVLLVINWVVEMSARSTHLPRLATFTTYEVSYQWNYSKPIAVLTPLGGENNVVIEYPSHTPPPGFHKISLSAAGKVLWVPLTFR